MSYIGRTTNKSSDIRRFNATSSTSATHTLTWTAPNEQSLLVTINGVKQQEDAYSVSGTILTLTSALVSTDKLEVIGINDIGTVITPAQNSVDTDKIQDDAIDTDKIQDDAVTADKLANSINTEIAANTAKVTNATHTGDVTGATALTIATDAVDIAMLSATGTASSSTFLRGDNSWAAAGGSNAPAFHIVKTATQNIADDTWVKVTWDSTIIDTNSGMSLANEKWTVPSGEGGKYFVYSSTYLYSDTSHNLQETSAEIRVNNTAKLWSNQRNVNDPMAQYALYSAGILDLAAADYIDIWVHSNVGSSNSIISGNSSGKHTFFGAYKLDGIA